MVKILEENSSLIKLFLICFLSFTTCSDSDEPAEPEPEMEEVKKGILVFSKTNEFRHASISDGIALITDIGLKNEMNVTATEDAGMFHSDSLQNYQVVVFCNTTGTNLLNNSQQEAFENFIQSGGGFVGIHSATDTYRDGSWSWYNDLVGAIVQVDPYHTSNSHVGTIKINDENNPLTAHLGTTWEKTDEYYYWELNGGYLYDENINLLTVESTGSNSYDAERPVCWYKEYDGGRSFYTSLGHNSTDYNTDEKFKELIENGLLWAANILP